MKVEPKTSEEIAIMREGGHILASTLAQVAAAANPGVTTIELDSLARTLLEQAGAKPSFLGYGSPDNPYPASLCTSVNSEVVHGIPGARKLVSRDIVGLDIGCWYKGLCTDMAITVPVGEVSSKAHALIKVTSQALAEGIKQVRSGATTGDIGHAVQTLVEARGYGVVRDLTGHGVGRALHEEPPVPNFGKSGGGVKLVAGVTIAIEPMVNLGGYQVDFLDDGWTVTTRDGSLSAHFEHTVVVTEKGCEILTT